MVLLRTLAILHVLIVMWLDAAMQGVQGTINPPSDSVEELISDLHFYSWFFHIFTAMALFGIEQRKYLNYVSIFGITLIIARYLYMLSIRINFIVTDLYSLKESAIILTFEIWVIVFNILVLSVVFLKIRRRNQPPAYV